MKPRRRSSRTVPATRRLTLINLELQNACNTRDGLGGAVAVRGKPARGSARGGESCATAAATTATSTRSTGTLQQQQRCLTGQPCDAPGDYLDDDLPWNADQEAAGAGGTLPLLPLSEARNSNVRDNENAAVLSMIGVTVRNSVAYGGIAWNGRGGAVAVLNRYSEASFKDCAFIGNEAWGGEVSDDLLASTLGGLDYTTNLGEGGGVFVVGAYVSFERCTFENQTAEKEGGAVYADGGAAVAIEGTTFRNNRIHDDYWDGGGALYVGEELRATEDGGNRREPRVILWGWAAGEGGDKLAHF